MTENDMRTDLQNVVQELQLAAQQVATVKAQINELEGTLDALATQEEDRPVYRQSGPVLLEVGDRDALAEDLRNSIQRLSEHATRIEEREKSLREQYESIVKKFEGAE
jgi:chaperonin cofactor prefoldin